MRIALLAAAACALAAWVTPSDTLVLSYVCGNTFRLYDATARTSDTTYSWTSTRPERGAVLIGRRLPGRAGSEAFFTASSAHNVAIQGLPRPLRATNGRTAPCNPGRDTSWPTAATLQASLALTIDSSKLAGPMVWDSIYSHSAIAVPALTASRDTIAKVLARFNTRVSGQYPSGILVLHFDAPPVTYAGIMALIDSLEATPVLESVRQKRVHEVSDVNIGRRPNVHAPK